MQFSFHHSFSNKYFSHVLYVINAAGVIIDKNMGPAHLHFSYTVKNCFEPLKQYRNFFFFAFICVQYSNAVPFT